MPISDEKRSYIFDLLDTWAAMDIDDLEKEVSKENIDILFDLNTELLADHVDRENMTPQEFCELVDELREAKRYWSRQLGDVIIKASDLAEVSGKEPAISMLREFKAKCPSRFYLRIADTEIAFLTRKYTQ
jgi:hypothetical protein